MFNGNKWMYFKGLNEQFKTKEKLQYTQKQIVKNIKENYENEIKKNLKKILCLFLH